MSMSSFASLRGRTGYLAGLRDSIPVALSYFTVSLAFGLYCAQAGVSVFASGLMSFSNMSSTGQFGGLQVIIAHGALFQLALTIILVNLRYLLMSVSLSQSLDRGDDGTGGFRMWQRLVIGWAVTDEIYALAMAKPIVTFAYYTGLMVLPILGWTGGAVTGALVGEVLPASLQSAFGVLLFAMFISIVIPPAKKSRPVLIVALGAAALSLLLHFLPWTQAMQPGWRIIVVACVVCGLAATFLPNPTRASGEAHDVAIDDEVNEDSGQAGRGAS